MLKKTHIMGGLVVAAACQANPVGIAASVFGSLLPDIDHPTSTMGKKVPFLPRLLRHRGFTHSLLFVGLVYLLIHWLTGEELTNFNQGILMVIPGILSHIFLDMMNRRGVELLYPFQDKIKFPILKIKTGGMGEWFCLFGLLGIAIFL